MQTSDEPFVGDVLAERYALRDLLKRSEGVHTHAAVDLDTGDEVVVKVAPLARIPASTVVRIEHEAAVLRALASRHIAPLLEFGRDRDRVFIVQPRVRGETLEARIERGPLPLNDCVTVGRHVFAALRDTHEAGMLHRDLKPSNVIVTGNGTIERATMVDLGLARSQWLAPDIRDLPVGTVRYMSPEQAGIVEHDVDHRSDLYSAGALLFECLVGHPLFRGSTLGDVLREHATIASTDPRAYAPQIPRAIAELVGRLLSKDPRDRYASADAVLSDLDEISRSLDQGDAEPSVVIGLHDSRRTLAEPAFVGRDLELNVLTRGLEHARGGDGGLVLLAAESGGGKTRLLEEFANVARGRDAWVTVS